MQLELDTLKTLTQVSVINSEDVAVMANSTPQIIISEVDNQDDNKKTNSKIVTSKLSKSNFHY